MRLSKYSPLRQSPRYHSRTAPHRFHSSNTHHTERRPNRSSHRPHRELACRSLFPQPYRSELRKGPASCTIPSYSVTRTNFCLGARPGAIDHTGGPIASAHSAVVIGTRPSTNTCTILGHRAVPLAVEQRGGRIRACTRVTDNRCRIITAGSCVHTSRTRAVVPPTHTTCVFGFPPPHVPAQSVVSPAQLQAPEGIPDPPQTPQTS